MDSSCEKVQEQNIKSLVEEQRELLRQLNNAIDNLVERNPKPECESKAIEENPDNVFDEIISILKTCRGLVRSADDKVVSGIANKVH